MSASHAAVAERLSGRVLIGFTYVSVGLLLIGFVLMVANGISPLDPAPGLDLASLPSSLVALEPAAYLWLGLLAVIAAPIGRVIVAGVIYAADGDMTMVAISIAIIVVIAVGVASAIAVTV